jgi:2-oxoglutarate ferredoxin oxidoreductase subunit alpha
MAKSDFVIRIGGDTAVGGVISTGENFTTAAARSGYYVFTFRSYPAEIKGGHAWYQVRISNKPVLSIGDGIDVFVAFDQEAYELHQHDLNEGGVLIYDSDLVQPQINGKRIIAYPVPFQRIARQELDFLRGTGVLIQGVMGGLFGVPQSAMEAMVTSRYKRRAELLEKNFQTLRYGYDLATSKIQKEDDFYLDAADNVSRLVMSGNDAIAAGALYAGCRFYAGYPITPASDILETLAREMPKYGGTFLQAEDEMASIGAVFGAGFMGVRAMTATSGPGLSLMTEILGLAAMAEVPVVIVDSQRSGPSTGMPTKLEQADLFHAIYGGHGDVPRIVVAPGSVADCFDQMVRAFNLAEEYQSPVIFLSDQSLSHRTETLELGAIAPVEIRNRVMPDPEVLKNGYKRFQITATGISPMTVPGMPGGAYVAPGLEHDEYGHPDLAPDVHEAMTQKRFRKLKTLQSRLEEEPIARYGHDAPEIGIISWGATEGAVREGVARAVEKGYKVAALHPRVLNPVQEKQLGDFARSVKQVIVPECNYQGQFAHHLAATLGIRPVRHNKYGGYPFTPGEILAKIEEVYQS